MTEQNNAPSCLPEDKPQACQTESEHSDGMIAAASAGESPFFAWTADRYFELYLLQRKGYSDSRKDAFLRFDQTVVTVAAGAIALSVAFLEKQPVSHEALQPLFVSWAACILSVLAILSSLLVASKADSAHIAELDECMKTGEPNQTKSKRWNRLVYALNSFGIISCVIGLTALVIFGVLNLQGKGAAKAHGERTQTHSEATTETGTPTIQGNSRGPTVSGGTTASNKN